MHAPLFAFPGHPDEKKAKQALGALDRSAGIATAAGAELVVIHPGFWLGREREQALDDVVAWLHVLRERLEQKDRAAVFGLEVMGRVNELGSIDDVIYVAERLPWVRPVIDFAHMHATTDGAFTDVDAFASVLESVDAVLEPAAPFHIHFSDIAYANRNETKHLPYGEGTLRAEPLRDALARFERPATVISESPDEALDAGDPSGALHGLGFERRRVGRDLGLVLLGLVAPAAVAEEPGQGQEHLAPDQIQLLARHDLDRFAQQRLGLLVAPLRTAHDPERHARGRA